MPKSSNERDVDGTISGFLARKDLTPEQRFELVTALLRKAKLRLDAVEDRLDSLMAENTRNLNYMKAGRAVIVGAVLVFAWLVQRGLIKLGVGGG